MKIDYIEGERAADYVAPDEDEIQQYNTYRELDEWGDGTFNSVPDDHHTDKPFLCSHCDYK